MVLLFCDKFYDQRTILPKKSSYLLSSCTSLLSSCVAHLDLLLFLEKYVLTRYFRQKLRDAIRNYYAYSFVAVIVGLLFYNFRIKIRALHSNLGAISKKELIRILENADENFDVCMYVWMYVWMYVCMYVCMFVCMYVNV
jgi:hypothetical protein